ncbi:MAG: hypothetical protein IPN34_20180 [Planctomycetes bacterium]|nr:hypothetical protein [Planctomycetota bacterium]
MTWLSSLVLGSLVSLSCFTVVPPRGEQEEVEAMLRNDPQVRLAEANLEKARAELVAARYDATLRILDLQSKRRELAQRLELSREQYVRMRQIVDAGQASATELEKLRIDMVLLEGELQSVELRFQQLSRPMDPPSMHGGKAEVVRVVRPAIPTEMAEQMKLVVEFPNTEIGLEDWLRTVRAAAPFKLIVSDALRGANLGKLQLGGGTQYSVGEAMHALADQHRLAFVLRDYGWILMPFEFAQELSGPAIPPDVPCTNAARSAAPHAGPSGPKSAGPTGPGGVRPGGR